VLLNCPTTAVTIINASPLLKTCDEAQDLCDQVASWLSGGESYDPEFLAENLTQIAMDLRQSMQEAVA